MSDVDKLKFVEENNLCRLCLSENHQLNSCHLRWECQVPGCSEKHHNSLHAAISKRATMQNGDQTEKKEEVLAASYVVRNTVKKGICLPLTGIKIKTEDGKEVFAYALIDSGSTVTLMSSSLFNKLGKTSFKTKRLDLSTMGGPTSIVGKCLDLEIAGADRSEYFPVFDVTMMKRLPISRENIVKGKHLHQWKHLKDLKLPEIDINEVDMLIGQDNSHLTEGLEKLSGSNILDPYAYNTRIGWTVYGLKNSKIDIEQTYFISDEVSQGLERFFDVDLIPELPKMTTIEAEIDKKWDDEITLVDGHFQLSIPFKSDNPLLPNNSLMAKRKLYELRKRLERDETLRSQYVAEFKNYRERGYIESINTSPLPGKVWYLFHFPVFSDKKPGKCRVVNHASLKFHGTSLNDEVHRGPNYTANIIDILTRFRIWEVSVMADIEGMYNQVHVPPEQRDFLRILWYENDDIFEEVREYRMISHAFGGGWCAAAAQKARNSCKRFFKNEYMELSREALEKNFYVDDFLKSVQNVSMAIRILKELSEMLACAGFKLKKIGSNNPEVLKNFTKESLANGYETYSLNLDEDLKDNTLGCAYFPRKDMLGFISDIKERPFTRRGVLATTASIYDPLGLAAPFLMRAKILLQEICRLKSDWDDPLPSNIEYDWKSWLLDLKYIKELKIGRWLQVDDDEEKTYCLNIFTDASEHGYGAVAYLVAQNKDLIYSTLIASKSRVSPLKTMTIPRLELCGAVLGCKLEQMIARVMDVELEPTRFFTDSTIVLHYINGDPRKYRTFVGNRVGYILNKSKPCQWQFVPSDTNIADIISRGISAEKLIQSEEWKAGPRFLTCSMFYPTQPDFLQVNEEQIEMKPEKNQIYFMKAAEQNGFEYLFEKISSWKKLVRIVAYVIKFIDLLCKKTCDKQLKSEEIDRAERNIFKLLQQIYITPSQRQDRNFVKLHPFSSDGVYRVCTRFMMGLMAYDEKFPVIMPQSPVTKVYIRYIHEEEGHTGVDRAWFASRKRVWILGGKKYIRSVLSKCVVCQKLKSKPAEQIIGPLPKYRIETGVTPFEVIGIDYFGHFWVKIARSYHKRWGLMITCMKTRAVHLEVSHAMTADSFMMALSRFIARRGCPSHIVSDNGSNFIGAANELEKLEVVVKEKKMLDFCLNKKIKWSFNPPAASHHGGVWERQIRSVRSLLMVIMKEQKVTDESLPTFFCLIEDLINSRPVTKLNENLDDLQPITPNMLLRGKIGENKIPMNYSLQESYRARWRQLGYLRKIFWDRWSSSYLENLKKSRKWTKEHIDIKIGDLVMLVKDNLIRSEWPIARVLDVCKGADGHTRVLKIKTCEGILFRPITKVVPLECDV